VGAVEGLATRYDRLAVVWVDAHGDLNTPASSPSGNEWGMPLRMLIDGRAVASGDVALVGARNLDPPEQRYVDEVGLPLDEAGIETALDDVDAVYVAFDLDAIDPAEEIAPFMPEPGGPSLADAENMLRRVAGTKPLAGAGFRERAPGRLASGAGARAYASRMGADGEPGRRVDRAPRRAGDRRAGAEHLPGVQLALPRRRARAGALGLRALRPPLPGAGARPDRAAR
jgi:arginase family enzyme